MNECAQTIGQRRDAYARACVRACVVHRNIVMKPPAMATPSLRRHANKSADVRLCMSMSVCVCGRDSRVSHDETVSNRIMCALVSDYGRMVHRLSGRSYASVL